MIQNLINIRLGCYSNFHHIYHIIIYTIYIYLAPPKAVLKNKTFLKRFWNHKKRFWSKLFFLLKSHQFSTRVFIILFVVLNCWCISWILMLHLSCSLLVKAISELEILLAPILYENGNVTEKLKLRVKVKWDISLKL